MIVGIMDAVSIPVMAKARIGHFVEAQILEALGVDYIDESEVLTPADERNHIDKHAFKVPFVCGSPQPRRGAPADQRGRRDDPHQGRGRHRQHRRGRPPHPDRHGRASAASRACARTSCSWPPRSSARRYELVKQVAADGKLPVVNFVAGGIATPADAALAMQLGAEGVFVGSGIFKSEDPARTAERDRPGHDPLRQPEDHRRGQQGPRRADARHRAWRRSPSRSAWRSGAGRPDATARSNAMNDADRRPGPPGRLRRARPRSCALDRRRSRSRCACPRTSTGSAA